MAVLETNPRYRAWLTNLGFQTPSDFLALQGLICSGHLDRHVRRLTLGSGPTSVQVLLKREHRIRWRDRFDSALAGFGWVAKSRREFTMLRALEEAGIRAPQALAAGEDSHGRAFLVVRELLGYRDLRQFLVELAPASDNKRRGFARRLGRTLARLHRARIKHGDLYAKHIMVREIVGRRQFAVRIVDWQRAHQRRHLTSSQRLADLAALDATVADELVSPRERLRLLYTYLRQLPRPTGERPASLRKAALAIRAEACRLLRRRRIREMRQPPLPMGEQNLIWVDGEALLMTREFHEEMRGQVPDCIRHHSQLTSRSATLLQRGKVRLPNARWAQLVFRGASSPWRWLWSRLSRKPLVAPELESMKVLFRLQRYGVAIPRLLAAGQRNLKPWLIESFLLTEPVQPAQALPAFLEKSSTAARAETMRGVVLLVRKMHQAHCYIANDREHSLADLFVVKSPGEVSLASVEPIVQCRHQHPGRAQRDLAALVVLLSPYCTRSALLRALLYYTDRNYLTPASRLFVQRILHHLESLPDARRVAA